ncbi:MAG: hypothetical protein J5I90_22590 [Caldilineales bacterium]|nr:hypothetical protein [Caldilineales bacterium]
MNDFEIVSEISDIETIATGQGVFQRRHLERVYGPGRWRKMKGFATIQLANGALLDAEVHWYEAHGIGRKEFKIKRIIQSHE